MAIEIVDFPIKTGWFSIAMLIYQRVMYMSYCVTHDMYIYIWVRCTFRAPRVLWLGLVIVIMIVYLNGKRTETMCMSVCGVSWYGVSCVCFTIRLLVSICFHITDASTQHVYKHTFVHKPYCFRYKPNKKTNKHFRISLRTIFFCFFLFAFSFYIYVEICQITGGIC